MPSTEADLAPSLVATFTGTGRGRILLIAHMDTVFQPGVAAQRPYQVVGDHGIGPGAGDDKQGIVTALVRVARAPRNGLPRLREDRTLIVNSNEEIGSPGSRALIASLAREADAALNLERGVPPDGLVVARKGSATATIEIQGRAAHSGLEPEKGRNAMLEAVHQIELGQGARESRARDHGERHDDSRRQRDERDTRARDGEDRRPRVHARRVRARRERARSEWRATPSCPTSR